MRNRTKTEALQSVLARISNAEAVPIPESQESTTTNMGVGSTEVARRTLTEQDIRQIIQDELDELEDAIASMAGAPGNPYATDLKRKANIFEAYLG